MTRDELEALVWVLLSSLGLRYDDDIPDRDRRRRDLGFVNAILTGADRYAGVATDVTERRAVLHDNRPDIGRQPTYGTKIKEPAQ